MNTPAKHKRYVEPERRPEAENSYLGQILDDEMRKGLLRVMTEFVWLEEAMIIVMAVLLGDSDDVAARYVMRAIKSPTGRIDVMKDLLENAPANQNLDVEYDYILKEFRKISSERNKYVHGKWWTDVFSKETFLDYTVDHNDPLHQVEKIILEDFDDLNSRIHLLHIAIHQTPGRELNSRKSALKDD